MHGTYGISAGGAEESVARIEALAKLMDGVLAVPGTNIRLGLDAVIGLVPVAGEPARRSKLARFPDQIRRDEAGDHIR